MTKTSGKQQVLTAISKLGVATSYEIFETTGLHSASVDKILKGLVENGELKREKKATTSSNGKQVFHYSIPAPTHTNGEDINGNFEDDDIEDDDDDWNDGDYGDDCDEDEEDDVHAYDKPENQVVDANEQQTCKVIFLIRIDDIPGFTYGPGGSLFARTISQFVQDSSRRFEKHGNFVISLFASKSTPETIMREMHDAQPEINFAIATTLTEAIDVMQRLTPKDGPQVDVKRFKSFVKNWSEYNLYCDANSLLGIQTAITDQPKVVVEAPVEEREALPEFLVLSEADRKVFDKLAKDGENYQTLTGEQLGMFFQKVSQFYLYILDDALKIESELKG